MAFFVLPPQAVTIPVRSEAKFSSSPPGPAAPSPWDDPRSVDRAQESLRRGGMVVLVDGDSGHADLIAAGSSITAELVNAMAVHGRGLPYLALSAARIDWLRLPPMASSWSLYRKPFTVSIEARDGVTTGISAADRARTIRVATSPHAEPADLVSPGHVFPLRARSDESPRAFGRVEAALALVKEAGAFEGAAMTEILDEAGAMASPAYASALSARMGLPVVGVGVVTARFQGPPPSRVAPPPRTHAMPSVGEGAPCL